ncbi:fimbrial protein [Klebsiella aerogenes]
MNKFFGLTLLSLISNSYAADWKSDMVLSPTTLTYSGNADFVAPGTIIGSTWSASTNVSEVFSCGILDPCTKGTMQPGSGLISTGLNATLDGLTYTVFETGVQGIGFIIGLKDSNANNFIPLQDGIVQTYPADGTSGYAPALGWTAKITYVKTNVPLKTGEYVIPEIEAAILSATNNSSTANAKVIINATNISVTAHGCTVNTPSANIDLGTIDVASLSTVGSTTRSGSFDVSLTCDSALWLKAVVTDQSNPNNTSNIVSLTSDSTASGVGVQFYYNGTGPLALGPDSSVSTTLNQFPVSLIIGAGTVSFPFQVKFVRTGNIVPGIANSLASITFSYQ